MKLSQDQLRELLRTLRLTAPKELACDECLKRLAEFAENELEGKSFPQGLLAIEQHLTLCGECREEYEALLKALQADSAGDASE